MAHSFMRTLGAALCLLIFVSCATTPTTPPGPPPQNLLGATDELQLVTELSLNLASEHGGDHMLVVLEVDGTLLTMKPGQHADPCSSVTDTGISNMQSAQPDSAELVRRIQDAGMKVIVVTSRGPECLQQTFTDLNSNGFNFADNSWRPQGGYPEPFLLQGGNRPVVYQNGVFFTAGQDKGVMLKALLEKTGDPQPLLIVMADHSREDLNAVMKIFSWSGTKVHAWRYTREDGSAPGP